MFFFYKQKTAYEIMPSLVGSEMCIRDRNKNYLKEKIIEWQLNRFNKRLSDGRSHGIRITHTSGRVPSCWCPYWHSAKNRRHEAFCLPRPSRWTLRIGRQGHRRPNKNCS